MALTRVTGANPMGGLMERYWLPVTRSEELMAGEAPQRVRLLGRNYVAFRNSRGAVGVLDENCPHRGASLALARNEDCTLQCLYHGWRIAPDGTIVETPSEPQTSTFKSRVRANAYPVWEAGGLVWAYFGAPETEPQKPTFEFTSVPAAQRLIVRGIEYCNWLQCLEGSVDSAHLNWLHTDFTRPDWLRSSTGEGPDAGGKLLGSLTPDPPQLEAETTDYGFRYVAIRPVPGDDSVQYVRATEFVMPFHASFPGARGVWAHHQMFVPIDDETCMFYYVQYRTDGQAISDEVRTDMIRFTGVEVNSVDGRNIDGVFPSVENTWLQDREAMRNRDTFSGFRGINNEDFAVQESMGAIYDRAGEHLGMSDVAVIRLRRVLRDSLRRMASGEAPIGLQQDVPYDRLRGGEGVIAPGEPWSAVLLSESGEKAVIGPA